MKSPLSTFSGIEDGKPAFKEGRDLASACGRAWLEPRAHCTRPPVLLPTLRTATLWGCWEEAMGCSVTRCLVRRKADADTQRLSSVQFNHEDQQPL